MNKTPTIQICCFNCKSYCKGNAETGYRQYCRKTKKKIDVNDYCPDFQPTKRVVDFEIRFFEKHKTEE